jgi:hypothetical protein
MRGDEPVFEVSEEFQHYLATIFWFKDHDGSDGTVEIDRTTIDPNLIKEVVRWHDYITIGLETGMLRGDYKIDVEPYLGLFPVRMTSEYLILSFDWSRGGGRNRSFNK